MSLVHMLDSPKRRTVQGALMSLRDENAEALRPLLSKVATRLREARFKSSSMLFENLPPGAYPGVEGSSVYKMGWTLTLPSGPLWVAEDEDFWADGPGRFGGTYLVSMTKCRLPQWSDERGPEGTVHWRVETDNVRHGGALILQRGRGTEQLFETVLDEAVDALLGDATKD